MFEIQGKFGTAKIYASQIEAEAYSQIQTILNHPIAKDAHIRIMPDCHAGAGCVIGFTAKLTDIVIPNLIGVDIGCGVISCNLGPIELSKETLLKLDTKIREVIPLGQNVRSDLKSVKSYLNDPFKKEIESICKLTQQNLDYVLLSLGTLGGGNHFIEIGRDEDGDAWLTIHTGSRNFGLKVATYFQKLAYKNKTNEFLNQEIEKLKTQYTGKELGQRIEKLKKSLNQNKIPKALSYLEGTDKDTYLEALQIAQKYAILNRHIIITEITKLLNIKPVKQIESVHNYISFKDNIVRKGSISAHKNEYVVIPFNMRDGLIIGKGKGLEDWNYSAPHGAGRALARSEARQKLSLEEFKNQMAGIVSTSVSESTLDEAPGAYKKTEEVLKYIKQTITIERWVKPIYNLKA